MSEPPRNMTAAELLDVTEVERLALRPGDFLVFKSPRRLTDAEYAELKERIQASLAGLSVRTMLLEDGLDVQVIRSEQAP